MTGNEGLSWVTRVDQSTNKELVFITVLSDEQLLEAALRTLARHIGPRVAAGHQELLAVE